LSLEHWETYYRSGALATCPMGPQGGYDQEVRDAWVAFFSELPPAAQILDVGTGNGAVALIARETGEQLGRDYRVHATDLARIDPARHLRDGNRLMAGIEFHAGVATEALPFETGRFDAVSGQYALEYMDTAAALAEIHRVLKAGGRAQFVLHHVDSVIVMNGRWSLRQSDLVLNETKIYRRLRRVVSAQPQTPAAAKRASRDLRDALDVLGRAMQQAEQQAGSALVLRVTLDAVQKLLAARTAMKPSALERAIDRAEAELRASVRRLNDLVNFARSESGMAQIEAEARTAGFVAIERTAQFHGGRNLVGWRLALRRA
jgi:ubiquinone/menaquinone biosynthesis C-methylase UbiE